MSSILNFFLDLIFPSICLSCDSLGSSFCKECQSKIVSLTESICPSCLCTTLDGRRHIKCKGNIEGLVSVWSYEGVVQKVIKEVKYRFYYASVNELVDLYITNLEKQKNQSFTKFLDSQPIIVPVPLHPKKQKLRGFNQAALIGRYLVKHWNLSYSGKIIQRHKFTKSQAELNKKQRLENIQDAFSPTADVLKLGLKSLKGRNVLLVDDVWTTGATMQTCAKVLKTLGAETIWALTLAR